MPPRALIIAIEDYPQAASLATPLKGTNDSATRYYRWLTSLKQVAPGDVWLCAGASLVLPGVRKFGTTRAEVIKAVIDLVAAGKDTTTEFYCFISSHGFCYPTRTAMDPMDIIVCADFVDPSNSGAACFRFQEFQQKLGRWLGGQSHYYFSDACRTQLDEDQIDPVNLGLTLKITERGVPWISSLFSTSSGDPAAIDSGFGQFLCDGLAGKGHSKGWVDGNEMWVLFELLADFVEHSVPGQTVCAVLGGGMGKIYKLPAIPLNSCQIIVQNALPTDAFEAQLLLHGLPSVTQSFIGPSGTLTAPPETYFLTVTHPTSAVVQVKPPASQGIDLFESTTVELQKASAVPLASGPTPASAPMATSVPPKPAPLPAADVDFGFPGSIPTASGGGSELKVDLPPNTTGLLHSVDSGTSVEFNQPFSVNVTRGLYRVDVMEAGRSVSSRMLRIDETTPVTRELKTEAPTQTHSNILKAVSGALGDGRVEFSEQLGSFADWDMGLWLAVLASSRILGPPGTFSKMVDLALETFAALDQGSSCVYLLCGLDDVQGEIHVAIGESTDRQDWQTANAVQNIAGLFQLRVDVSPGTHYVSIDLPNAPRVTLPLMSFINRVSLVTISRATRASDKDLPAEDNQQYLRHLRIYQHNLPLYRFLEQAPVASQPILHDKMNLRTIRALYIMQSQYCQRHPISACGFRTMPISVPG